MRLWVQGRQTHLGFPLLQKPGIFVSDKSTEEEQAPAQLDQMDMLPVTCTGFWRDEARKTCKQIMKEQQGICMSSVACHC